MAKQDKEVCTISIPRNGLDSDYTFYESGKIRHVYDRHIYKGGQNREDVLSITDISADLKIKLLEHCPKEHVQKIKNILM